jgi:nitrite reductase (NO-forming)
MADGMYGAVIVDPKGGRPTAREYLLVQSEFYGSGGEYAKMLNNPPDFVVFNGQANRYKTTPLAASVGELVRIFMRPNRHRPDRPPGTGCAGRT